MGKFNEKDEIKKLIDFLDREIERREEEESEKGRFDHSKFSEELMVFATDYMLSVREIEDIDYIVAGSLKLLVNVMKSALAMSSIDKERTIDAICNGLREELEEEEEDD